MSTEAREKERAATIQGLRELAMFLEQHPEVPCPMVGGQNAFIATKAEMRALARVTSWRKEYVGSWFTLAKDFPGDVALHLNIERSTVCRKVVTGTKVVPARPEHEVEEFEWVCDEPLLQETV